MDAYETDDYQLLKEGDLVKRIERPKSGIGIVTGIGECGTVHIFWPSAGKVTHSGKKWSEEHLGIVSE
jgi:hypothetical protein